MSQHFDVIVVGSGPAGFTAGLYASRANLSVAVFEGLQPGGQLMITSEVENYPGFEHGIQGPEMMDIFRKQANRFGAKSIFETIKKVDFSEKPFKLWNDSDKLYTADAVIVSTGATARTLKIPSEETYWGKGISACATCDGFFFRGKKVIVVGGGDTAMEDASYLTNFTDDVTIVHRRQEFRASQIMIEKAKENPKIKFLLDSTVDEFLGEERMGIHRLTHTNIKNVVTGEITKVETEGAFIAIGHTPNASIFKDILDMDDQGYLVTQGKSTYTNVPGVFACGDVQDHTYRQAITAAGSGCSAAIDAERWLSLNK